MKNKLVFLISGIGMIIFLYGCYSNEPEPLGKNMPSYCSATKLIAKSYENCSCNIVFRDYINEYTFTGINSVYYQIGPPCSQNVFYISYINSVHDHNEPDYRFGFYLPMINEEDFFKPGSFNIDTISIFENSLTGGFGGPKYNIDITFMWENIELNEGIYSGTGKFIINKEIPTSFPGYSWPVQEIPFEFCSSRRTDN